MPKYDFRCPECGREFEVSRPMSRSSDPAFCPSDNTECEKLIRMPMTYVKSGSWSPPTTVPKPGASGYSHFGHSHGAGVGGHSHGGAAGGLPPAPGEESSESR
jgi:putative FmdB family regulatory protein